MLDSDLSSDEEVLIPTQPYARSASYIKFIYL